MSLDNIQLPPFIIADLFKHSLVELNTQQVVEQNAQKPLSRYLGNHKQGVSILVSDKDAVFLKETDLSFLLGILTACKLSMADIALFNLFHNPLNYRLLTEEMNPGIVLLFGVKPSDIDLPIDFPFYQIQKYNNQQYLYAPSLYVLINNIDEKKNLWNSLKRLFLIP